VASPRQQRGARGEAAAASWYQARGYEVLARNWRCREGELDLVLRSGRTYVFCEVKARASAAFGAPVEAVTASKQARIRRLAARWLQESGARPAAVRFDVASVLGRRLDVVEQAF
jgi:putative endonuclease